MTKIYSIKAQQGTTATGIPLQTKIAIINFRNFLRTNTGGTSIDFITSPVPSNHISISSENNTSAVQKLVLIVHHDGKSLITVSLRRAYPNGNNSNSNSLNLLVDTGVKARFSRTDGNITYERALTLKNNNPDEAEVKFSGIGPNAECRIEFNIPDIY